MNTVFGRGVAYGLDSYRNDDWRDAALCRQVDPETFFPVGHSGPALEQEETAKRICLPCPVRSECLKYAVDNEITDGVWGGVGELDRRWDLRQKPKPEVRAPKIARIECRHVLDETNTIVKDGYRYCRECTNARKRAYRLAGRSS